MYKASCEFVALFAIDSFSSIYHWEASIIHSLEEATTFKSEIMVQSFEFHFAAIYQQSFFLFFPFPIAFVGPKANYSFSGM
jgi:hypothetical protein